MKFSFAFVGYDNYEETEFEKIVEKASEGLTHCVLVDSNYIDNVVLFLSEREVTEEEADLYLASWREAFFDFEEGRYDDMDEWEDLEEVDWYGVTHKDEDEISIKMTLANKKQIEYIK